MLVAVISLLVVAAIACGDTTSPTPTAVSGSQSPQATATSRTNPSASPTAVAKTGGVFRRLWADPPTLDPHLTSDSTSGLIVAELFSGLVTLDPDLNLVPDIAESWHTTDGIVYTFKLLPNVKFHNGHPVKAQDFKWSFERAASPTLGSPVAETYLNDIVGFAEYHEGKASEITGIRVVDELTLEITIDSPKPYFLAKLTYPTSYVLDRQVIESKGDNWWQRNAIGTGPFKLKEYRIGESLVLERFDGFYREPAKLDRVEMNLAGGQEMVMYENNEVDIAGVSIFDMDRIFAEDSELKDEVVAVPPSFSISYIGFNTKMAPFDDANFRRALAHAIDKEMIAEDLLAGVVQPAYGILPPGFPAFNPDLKGLEYDPELARTLLADSPYAGFLKNIEEDSEAYESAQSLLAGSKYAGTGNLPRITVTSPGTGGPITSYLAEIVDMWEQELGVQVDVQQVEWSSFLEDLDTNKLQVFAGLSWQADYPDPHSFLDVLFYSKSPLNHGSYENANVDRLLEQARTEQDVQERIGLYNSAEQIIVDDAAWIPLWFDGNQYMLIKSWVKGYSLSPLVVPRMRDVSIER